MDSIYFFSENVKHLRTLEGVTQAEMGDLIGFKRSTWNGYERGDSLPSVTDLVKIADYFGITETDLLHIEVPLLDIHKLYNRYLMKLESVENIGNTPRAKGFLSYFKDVIATLPRPASGSNVTESVTKPVTNKGKSDQSPYSYITGSELNKGHFLNEETAQYGSREKLSDSARIARLEGIIASMASLLTDYIRR